MDTNFHHCLKHSNLKNKTQCESHKIRFIWALLRTVVWKTAWNYLGVGVGGHYVSGFGGGGMYNQEHTLV